MFEKYDFVSRTQSVLILPNARVCRQISSCHVPWGIGRVDPPRTSDRACQHEDTLSHSQREAQHYLGSDAAQRTSLVTKGSWPDEGRRVSGLQKLAISM